MNTGNNKKIEEILNSLDGVNRAPAPDFFFTRLRARMERQPDRVMKRPWLLRPAFALAISVIVLIINAAILIRKEEKQKVTTLADTEKFQSIASEYSLNENAPYDLTQEK